jgi:hypothetical protein
MNKKEILLRAIVIAIDNGFDWDMSDATDVVNEGFDRYKNELEYVIFPIIFSHGFAEAVFGKKELEMEHPAHWRGIHYEWQDRLSEMVLDSSPICYLGKFLKILK